MILRRLQITLQRALQRNSDIAAIWLGLLVAQHHVPVTHFLGRDDLLPWMMLTLSLVAFLRGRRYGLGPHPVLTPRTDWINALLQRGAAAVAPWALLYVYDAARELNARPLGFAGAVAVAVVILVAIGSSHGQTAWNPERRVSAGMIIGSAVFLMGSVGGAGFAAGSLPDADLVTSIARAIVVGLAFLTIGLMAARVQNHHQRVAAGRKDGKPHREPVFSAFLATAGPTFTLAVVFMVVPNLDFDNAFVASMLVVVWAGVVWPTPGPIMVSCVLHEVIPIGGSDPRPQAGQAQGFDAPPAGALRFNPLATQRTLVMHPWLVPVRSSRIAELDDPIRPLWESAPPLLADHLLGDASFEPDPVTRQDQWEVLTIRLRGRDDVQAMGGNEAQVRRIVVMRPFPPPGHTARARLATYRWEGEVPEETIQVIDATTPDCQLRDGDVLVVSAEGVAKAYEVEIGAPVYRVADALQFRPPQLEDYVEVG